MKAILTIAGIIFILAGAGISAVSQIDVGTALIGLNLGVGATLLVGGFIILGLASIAGSLGRMAVDLGDSAGLPNPDYISKDKSVGGLGAGAAVGLAGAAGAAGAAIGSQYDKAADGVDKAIDKVAEAAEQAKETAGDAVEAVKDTAGDAVDVVKDTAGDAVDAVKETSGNVAGSFAASFDEAKDKAKETAGDVVETASDTVEKVVDEVAAADQDVADQAPQDEAQEAEGDELYVVEERVIRGKQARILSDQTVEAETNEGWMRFENIEHLEEYIDANEA